MLVSPQRQMCRRVAANGPAEDSDLLPGPRTRRASDSSVSRTPVAVGFDSHGSWPRRGQHCVDQVSARGTLRGEPTLLTE